MKICMYNLFILMISVICFSKEADISEQKWTTQFLITANQNKEIVVDKDQYLSGTNLYRRCYQLLLRYPLAIDSEVIKQIEAGTIDAEDACVQMVTLSVLNEDGELKNPSLSSFENQRLMATFNLLHQSWFEAYSFSFSGENFGTGEYSDFEQMGYAFSNILFRNKKVTSILKGTELYQPVRDKVNKNEFLLTRNAHLGNFVPWNYISLYYNDDSPMQGQIPQAPRGLLRGVSIDTTPFYLKKFFIQYEKFSENTTTALKRHFGGGLLGNSTYLLLNLGDKVGMIQDGNVRIPRRWTKAVFKDILCRNLPVLSESDAKKYVSPKADYTFSRAETCVQCHATTDQFSGGIRDIQGGVNTYAGLDYDKGTKELEKNGKIGFSFLRSVHESKLLKKEDYSYAFAEPTGRLRMRDFNGTELDEPYVNLEDLGEKISGLDDFYLCQTRRYFKFLTGIDIETDPLILHNTILKQQDKIMLTQLYSWAMDLKKNQQLKSVLEQMIRSPYFRHKDFFPIKSNQQ